jgi:hypothetical protein
LSHLVHQNIRFLKVAFGNAGDDRSWPIAPVHAPRWNVRRRGIAAIGSRKLNGRKHSASGRPGRRKTSKMCIG